jgi:ERCC4-type nuclease
MTAGNDRVRIVADDRENAGGAIGALQRHEDVALSVRRLRVGDFLVGEYCIVERKTLSDFARSVIDARLFRQASAMVGEGRRAVLFLEGCGANIASLGVSREALQGALITVSVFFGLAVLRSRDVEETARLLVYLGRQAQAQVEGALGRPGYRPKGRRARQLYVLQGLPGIGPERAERLLDRFGSVERTLSASAEELAAVEGIGPRIAERIRWCVE